MCAWIYLSLRLWHKTKGTWGKNCLWGHLLLCFTLPLYYFDFHFTPCDFQLILSSLTPPPFTHLCSFTNLLMCICTHWDFFLFLFSSSVHMHQLPISLTSYLCHFLSLNQTCLARHHHLSSSFSFLLHLNIHISTTNIQKYILHKHLLAFSVYTCLAFLRQVGIQAKVK